MQSIILYSTCQSYSDDSFSSHAMKTVIPSLILNIKEDNIVTLYKEKVLHENIFESGSSCLNVWLTFFAFCH